MDMLILATNVPTHNVIIISYFGFSAQDTAAVHLLILASGSQTG